MSTILLIVIKFYDAYLLHVKTVYNWQKYIVYKDKGFKTTISIQKKSITNCFLFKQKLAKKY